MKTLYGNQESYKPIEGLIDGTYRIVAEVNRPLRIELFGNTLTLNVVEDMNGKWYGLTTQYECRTKLQTDYKLCKASSVETFVKLCNRLVTDTVAQCNKLVNETIDISQQDND